MKGNCFTEFCCFLPMSTWISHRYTYIYTYAYTFYSNVVKLNLSIVSSLFYWSGGLWWWVSCVQHRFTTLLLIWGLWWWVSCVQHRFIALLLVWGLVVVGFMCPASFHHSSIDLGACGGGFHVSSSTGLCPRRSSWLFIETSSKLRGELRRVLSYQT